MIPRGRSSDLPFVDSCVSGCADMKCSEIIDMKSRISLYETLLDQLKGQVDSAGQLAITKALRGV
jgi:hypothetical protein